MTVTTAQVTTLLENVLFESTSAATANAPGWTGFANLSTSYSTVSGLSSYLATQPEAQIAEQVVRYYQAALSRVPSPSEISFYVSYAEKGLSSSQLGLGASAVSTATWGQIAAFFTNSAEFKADFNLTSTTNAGLLASNESLVITGFYTNILGRAPTSAEIQTYETAITNGADAAGLLQFFSNSPEYEAKAATTIETNLGNAGVAAIAVAAAGGNPLAVTTPIGSLPGNTPTQFVLTTGVDNLTGGTGSNTFVGTLDTGSATLGGADTITGTGGNNTLSLTDGVATDKSVVPVGATITNIQTLTLKTAGNAGSTANTTFDVSGISGLTSVTVTSSGSHGDFINAASTTNVTDVSLNKNNAVTITGGDDVTVTGSNVISVGTSAHNGPAGAVTVTENGSSTVNVDAGSSVAVTTAGSGSINIDQHAATTGAITVTASAANTASITVGTPTVSAGGTVTITDTTAFTSATNIGGTIHVYGGTTVAITENITVSATVAAAQASTAVSQGTVHGSSITVTAGKKTTSVSVTQSAKVAATAGHAAGALQAHTSTAAIQAGPGVQGVAAKSTPASALVPGVIGVADGAVAITDANKVVATVTVDNFLSLAFTGNALATLNLAGTGGAVTLTDAAPANTTLALNVNGLSATTLNDVDATLKEIDVTTTGASKFTGGIQANGANDTTLVTLKVAGTGSFTDGSFADSKALTSIAVSGSASFADGGTAATGVDQVTGLTSFTTTSSGTIAAYLNDQTQSFTGASGADTITVDASLTASKAITAGTASTNELILDGTTGVAGATSLATKVTGFQILGVENLAAATINAGTTDATAITKLDVVSLTSGANVVSGVTSGAAVSIDSSYTTVGTSLTVEYADFTGVNDTTNLTLAKNVQALALTLEDSNSTGVGTVNIIGTGANVISTLTDTNVTHLSVSGGTSLTIGDLAEAANATSIAIADSDTSLTLTSITGASNLGQIAFSGTGSTTITTLTPGGSVTGLTLSDSGAAAAIGTLAGGATLTTVDFGGTGAISITTLTDTSATLTLANSGTATESITTFANAGATLATLNLSGNIALGTDVSATAGHFNVGVTGGAGVTVAGSTDNAHVNIDVGAGFAIAGATDTITLGNGNDSITDASTAGTVKITVGSGQNYIDVSAGVATTYVANIALGSHSAPDEILLAHNTTSATPAATTAITGAVAGDELVFTSAPTTVLNVSAADQITITAQTSLANAINWVDNHANGAGYATAGSLTVFSYGSNTYVLESVAQGTGTVQTGDTVIELVGTHTLGAISTTNTHLVLVGS